jgi:hypothetical protein
MMVLPPFQPTCFAKWDDDMYKFGCPDMYCSKDPACTVDNPKCCMHLNYKLLVFFDKFMSAKCLQNEYLLLHGTALGAMRNKTILYHTADVDVGVTLHGLQFLELNATRQELWRHGYALYQYPIGGLDSNARWWKLRPHLHHPDPAFRAAFRAYNEDTDAWQKRQGDGMAAYVDLWPMWPVPNNTTSCYKSLDIDTVAALSTPWDLVFARWKSGTLTMIDTCSARFAAASHTTNRGSQRLLCTMYLVPPLNQTLGLRLATVHNQTFPGASNFEE